MFKDLISKTRSYRRYQEDVRLKLDDLTYLVDCARLSPSAMNRQPLRYRLVYSETECEKLFPRLKWAGYLSDWDGPMRGERPPAYIIMLLPREPNRSQLLDAGISAQSIVLAATERGWGGCMLASVDKAAVQKEFKLPLDMEIVLVIALGVPVEKVVVEAMDDPEAVEYWRDKMDVHHVPKRGLQELILN